MEKTLKLLVGVWILIFLLAGTFLVSSEFSLTGKSVEEIDRYTHTRAICDEDNFCQDYKITCENNSVEEMEAITGATVQHSEKWEDPRENPERLC